MKLLFSILFLIISTFGFSQEFDFNLVTNYTSNQDEIISEKIVFSNINNLNYFLSIKKNSSGNTANLWDFKNMKMHDLTFIENNINGENLIEFKYLKTESIKQVSLTKNYSFKFETVEEDSIYKTVKMTLINMKKKEKKYNHSEIIIKIKKDSKNLFPLFRLSYLHLFENRTDIDLNENGIIVSAKYISQRKLECNLSFIKEVNFKIKIPN